DAPKAPGMKYMHYSPTQPVILMRDNWGEKIAELLAAGNKIGVLASDEQITELTDFSELAVYSLGSRTDENAASQRLYAGLRYFDMTNVTVILAEGYPKDGIGVAFMNRLEKAASSMYPE
ncbi:Sua5 family C-terminal domain-containing protein, partial [Jeotgalibaca porci]